MGVAARRPSDRLRELVLGASLCLAAGSAQAQRATIGTRAGDGGVTVQVDAYGAYGYRPFGNGAGGAGDAMYDPVGSVGPSSTTWESGVYLRMPPSSTFLTIGSIGSGRPTGGLPDPGFLSTTPTTAQSAFTHAGLEWQLRQSVQDVLIGVDRVGTILIQEYTIRNPGTTTIAFDMVRYYEGDLFLGLGAGVPDGGGHLFVGTEELVFETDRAGEPAATTNLIGITACGGTIPARGRYEVNAWPAFPTRLTSDQELGDVVFNDGADPDEFVDAGLDYDVGIALANKFSLDPGQVTLYVTTTVFGTLPPADVVAGCGLVRSPIANAGPDDRGCPGATFTLDGFGSFDSDAIDGGLSPTWTWDLDVAVDSSGNLVPDDDVDATGPIVAATFPLGTTTVQLTYTDDDGDVARDTKTITVEDLVLPVIRCSADLVVSADSYLGATAAPTATASDDCATSPAITNDRTAGGADATDTYPCGNTLVTFTATDDAGNVASCSTSVLVIPDPASSPIGPALRVRKLAGDQPELDWSLATGLPPTSRFAVLRGTARVHPIAVAPTGNLLVGMTWADPELADPLVFYDVRSMLCDGSLSPD
jgi:hypothetical protein